MAAREAAGKLGLGLAALENITGSSFRLAVAGAKESMESTEKSIYICTLETLGPYASFAKQVIHRIPWNTDDGSDQVETWVEAAYGKRLIKTCRYQYHSTQPCKPASTIVQRDPAIDIRLNGAFLL